MKKKVLSIMMSMAMLASAAPMAIAENSTTPDIIDLLRNGTSVRPGVNVTAGKKATADGELEAVTQFDYQSDGSLVEVSTDGNENTFSYFHGIDCYYQIDLGIVRSITNITWDSLSYAGDYMKREFDVLLSNDPTFPEDSTVSGYVKKVMTVDSLGYVNSAPVRYSVNFSDDETLECKSVTVGDVNTEQRTDENGETKTYGTVSDLSATVKGPVQYRYIRIQKNNANHSHTGISMVDIRVNGYDEYYEQDLTRMSGVTATSNSAGYEDTNPDDMYTYVKDPANVIDGKYEVELKANGKTKVDGKYTAFIAQFSAENPYVQVDLTAVRELSRVKVLPYRGSEETGEDNQYLRRNIMVYASNDESFENAKLLYNGQKVEERDVWIDIDLTTTADYYRYIRVCTATNADKLGVTEIIALGYDVFDVEVAESTVPAGQTGVTNVETTTIPTVKAGFALDPSTVNSNTVYALRQVPVAATETTEATTREERAKINPVMLDDYTIGIDLATLLSYNTYKIVVSGVKTTAGNDVEAYTSGTFTTGLIAPVAYSKDAVISNVAVGKSAYSVKYVKAEDGTVSKEAPIALTYWVDGNVNDETTAVYSAGQRVWKYSAETPSYGYIDLGRATKITAVGDKGTNWWYHYAPIAFYGTNTDPTTLTDPVSDANTVMLAEITQAQVENYNDAVNMWGANVANGGKWSQTSAPATTVNANQSFRYVIMVSPQHGEIMPGEVMVYSAYTTEDVVKSVSIEDGTRGLTNVSNAMYWNIWDHDSSTFKTYVNNGAPIEIKFADDVDMSSVTNVSVKLSSVYKKGTEKETLTKVEYTPIIDNDNKTLKIDLSELETYQGTAPAYVDNYNYSYRIEITSAVTSVDSTKIAQAGRLVDFTTGEIAKVPYQEGKIVKNVALGKTANYKDAVAGGNKIGTYAPSFTNGLYGAGESNDNFMVGQNNAVMIDLGNEYDVRGFAYYVDCVWHMDGIDIYFQNDNSFDTTGKTPAYQIGDNMVKNGNIAVNADDSRYVMYNVTTGAPMYMCEAPIYAYVDAAKPDVYFTSPKAFTDETNTDTATTLYATAENAAGKTLILAEYDATGALISTQKAEATNGTAKLSAAPTAGHSYKAFVWDSFNGLTPATKSVKF